MRRRTRTVILATQALAVALLLLFAAPAFAQSHAMESPARALQKKAMEEDYLNTDYDKATEKLNQAIAKCGTSQCGIPLRAQLKRDLATIQAAAGKKDQALASMTEAFKIDAGLQLDPNYKTKELEAIYNEAKRGAGGGGPVGPPPSGDFTHTPVTVQQVRTPIPIYVEYPGSETLKSVIAKYKGLGMTEWKRLELKSIGSGWGANTPCTDVQAGDFQYFLQGFNDQGDPVASSGDRTNPFHVKVTTSPVADPPHLPGQSPPTQCADVGDCPPDFPGCKKGGATETPTDQSSLKGEGESCEDDSECKSGTCKDTKCTAPPETGPKRRKFWVGVNVSIDGFFLKSSSDVCALNTSGPNSGQPTNSQGYYCANGGTNFPLRLSDGDKMGLQAGSIIPGESDSVGGGIVPGDVRVEASFDYAINYNMMAGIRFGYVANSYTASAAGAFPPIHIEGRYTYVFGDKPIGNKGFHPFIMAGLGAARFDSSVSVAVFEKPFAAPFPNGPQCPPPGQTGSKCAENVNAWEFAGPFFLDVGGGVRWELVPRVAALLDLKLVGAIGATGNGFAFIPTPEFGMQFGF